MHLVPVMWMWIVWAALATAMVALLLYKNALTRNEEDHLFLDSAGESHHRAQEVLCEKCERIAPIIRLTEISTAVMTAAIAGFYLWDVVKHIML